MEKKDYLKRLCFYTWKIRRILSVLFLFVFIGINALRADTIVGKVELNISVKNASILQVFTQIKQQTSFNFVYNDRDISQIGLKTINLKNVDIVTVLDKCIEGTDLVYEFMGNIVIFKRRAEMVRDSVKEGKIVGVVKDERGFPLPGVTVQIKNMKLGTATDKDGRYAFRFVLGQQIVLEYSFIGMETVEIKYTGQDTINVVMKESKVALEDVVVTGYANISRQSYTGNVKTMTSAELKKISQVNVLKSIQVLDPSFRIAVNNDMGSNPNVMPKISIRGDSGIGLTELDEANVSQTALQNNPNLPTFILDGFEVSVNKVYDMDINRIESITLLKDAAATAIYGSRAANGVVVITTVTPKDGEILINYGYNLNVQVPDLRDYNLMNAKEKVEAEKEAGLFDQAYYQQAFYHAKLRLIERGNNTDWLALPLRNTASSKHYLRMEGGTTGFRYGIDVNYQGNNGVMKGSERKTFGLGLELQYNIGKLLFKNSATYTGVNSEESPFGSFSKYTTMNPYYSYLDEDGTVAEVIKTATSNGTISNPLYDAYLGSFDKTKSKEFIDNFSIQYYLTNKINFKGSIALTYTTGSSNAYTSPESGKYYNKSYKGEITVGNTTATVIDGSIFGYYNDMIGYHNINLFAGINVKESSDESRSVYVRDIPAGGFANPQFAREFPNAPTTFQQKTRLFGTIVSLNYTYQNIYLLDATWRMDGNSSFGSESRFAPFWSMGLGLNIHNYAFIKGINWLSEFKIRGSYGVTGKANFPANTARTLYSINSTSVYPTGLGGNITAMGNKNLKWEKTKITDLGTTINILDGLFVFTGTYYFRRTVDLIADMYIPSSSGFLSYKDNIGEITNNGYEISLRVKALAKSDAQLYFTANVAGNKNKIKKISESLKSYNQKIEEKYQENANKTEAKKPLLKYVEGASTTSIYAMRSLGINPQTGEEMFRYKDGTYGTQWLASENVAIGNTEPKMNGTLSSNLFLHGVTLDVYFTYTYGGQQYNQTLQTKIENADIENNVDKRVFTDRWKKQGDIAGFKSLKQYNVPTNPTSRFVQDDNTLTLQPASVRHQLP